MREIKALSVPLLLSTLLFSGCHEADTVLYPISRATEDLNATASQLSLPLKDLPFSDIHFKHRSLVLEKRF